MSGLFFSFETSSFISFSQFSLLFTFFIPSYSFFSCKNRLNLGFKKCLLFFLDELKPLMGSNSHSGSMMIFISLLLFILLNNLQGLFPYTFTWSSHLLFSLSLALPFWLCILVMGLMINLKKNLSHLVPSGTPIILMSFMVLIETLSIFIRPITLSVRLAANITAGHLLLSLISWKSDLYLLNIIIQLLMFILEIMVSIIQSYVFTMLLILYMEEEN